MSRKKLIKTLRSIEELEHYLSESQVYGLNMVSITTTTELLSKIKNNLLDEGSNLVDLDEEQDKDAES